MNRTLDGVLKPSLFNAEYYNKHLDRQPAGVQAYQQITDHQHMQGCREMAKTVKKTWPSIRKVLVLGCGRGEYVKAFQDIGVDAVGVDYSDYATTHLVEGLSRTSVVKANICELSFAKAKEFDVVLAFDVFNCIRTPALLNALKEAARVGDMVIVDTPVNPDDSHPDMSSIHGNFDVSVYSQTWWIQQFTKLGLEYFRGQEYTYPNPLENSLWSDKLIHAYTMYYRHPLGFHNKKTVPNISKATGDKDLRIAWWANGPWTPTGYGVGTEQVVYKLAEYYPNVAVLCNYGLEGRAIRMGAQEGRYKTNLIMFPKLFEPAGGDAAQLVVQNWKPDIVTTLYDIWVGEGQNAYTPRPRNWLREMFKDLYWIAYVPVDHDPVPQPVLNQCRQPDRVVSMSRFGQQQLMKYDVGSEYIPHGVYTDTFKPPVDEEAKRKAKDNLILRGSSMDLDNTVDWGNEDFIIGINAANKDTKRKGYEEMFRALNHFLVNNPDAAKDTRLYLHTWSDFPGGMPLYGLAASLDVHPYTKTTHKWYMYSALSSERMAEIYQGFDIFMNCAHNEGFGIPIIEAQACGVPVIATEFTSMTELVRDCGWLVKPIRYEIDMLMSNTANPNHYEIAEYIEKAYNSPDTVKKLGEKSRRNAVDHYDVETVVQPLWVDLFNDVERELKIRKPVEVEMGDWIQ